jgi:DNA invertase Pin-like site-specific DNA recombinase
VNDRTVEGEYVFGRHAATDLSVAYAILVPQRRARIRAGQEGRPPVTSAAIYARVSSARQKKDQTIGSQTAALRDRARQLGAELPEEWVFEDEGHSGATLVRPALERLRDVVAGVGVDVVLCYSPDRLARKFAYQALLIEEFARAGTKVEFIKGPRGDSPEDQLMVQFQGMFAECEKAQLMERYRRGKAHRGPLRVGQRPGRRPRSATATSTRPQTAEPDTRSWTTRRRSPPSCSAATPTTAPPSPT